MGNCRYCLNASLINKLGRCRDCMLKAWIFALLCWGLWGYLAWSGAEPTSTLAALVGALLLSLLGISHSLMAIRHRRKEKI
ncbi:DUF3624 family protein [Motiliproteus coralliicola]|uniref:DUF3624 family protein n=1 Tax=Motiliproteus coralliicola TaxID=2283196 RepID=A0A369WG13_9GAMM|nr:DUF3624 family protein [Motiliproteus coralliicola]RDE19546.1 DUF3624 family protein [Motiliproteus coralliicola]